MASAEAGKPWVFMYYLIEGKLDLPEGQSLRLYLPHIDLATKIQ